MKFLKEIQDWRQLHNEIVCGDSLDGLKLIPDNSIDCCITSPPYYGLRDYGHENQIGLEKTIDEYLNKLLQITAECKRILKPTGTLWWNHGDSYQGSGAGTQKTFTKEVDCKEVYTIPYGSNPRKRGNMDKCLMMTPYRLALRMIDEQGWIMRNQIIWFKPNCMPSSVKDRFTVDYEPVFFFTKSKKYYFKQLFEDTLTQENRPHGVVRNREYGYQGKYKVNETAKFFIQKGSGDNVNLPQPANPQGRNKRCVWKIVEKKPYAIIEPEFRKEIINFRELPTHDVIREYLKEWKDKKGITIEQIEQQFGSQAGHHWFERNGSYPSKEDWIKLKELLGFDEKFDEPMTEVFKKSGLKQNYPNGRNKRCVWRVTTKSFKEAHFATFPEDLIRPMIEAGCPEHVCKKCGKAREIVYKEKEGMKYTEEGNPQGRNRSKMKWNDSHPTKNPRFWSNTMIIGLTDCGCNAGWDNGVVLDPFMGAYTTAKTAKDMGRNFIGFELSEGYCAIGEKRLRQEVLF